MQLTILNKLNFRITLTLFAAIITHNLSAQNGLSADSTYRMKAFSDEKTANFLSSYYNQSGDSAAVTGGIGTQQLDDISTILVVNVPLDSTKALNVMAGADLYSSASTDNIDNVASSASSSDMRAYTNVTLSKLNLEQNRTMTYRVGFSMEYDYTSFSVGLGYTEEWNEGNSELSFNFQAFFDQWQLIYPIELRNEEHFRSGSRNSYNLATTFSQVLSKRSQISFTTEAIVMNGLLSTPFHRVYFRFTRDAVVEKLPETRIKVPLGIRFNYYISPKLITRTYCRLYTDNFGINALTAQIELPVEVVYGLKLMPFFRFHTQSASKYFAPYRRHNDPLANYYTSDYDLAELTSITAGGAIKISPLNGIISTKAKEGKRTKMLKDITLRGGIFEQSYGLSAYFASIDLGFTF